MIAVCDVDDLIDEAQIVDLLVPIKRKVPDFRVACYAVPNRLGSVVELRRRYPWITFGIHGWEHTPFECLTWTDDDTEANVRRALEMGYDPLFKAPNWISHAEIITGCHRAGVVFHHHDRDKGVFNYLIGSGTRLFPGISTKKREWINVHTHILKNPVTDYIEDHPGWLPENLVSFHHFATPIECARKA